MFSKKARKIDEIFAVDLTLTKGQLISKCPYEKSVSSKIPFQEASTAHFYANI